MHYLYLHSPAVGAAAAQAALRAVIRQREDKIKHIRLRQARKERAWRREYRALLARMERRRKKNREERAAMDTEGEKPSLSISSSAASASSSPSAPALTYAEDLARRVEGDPVNTPFGPGTVLAPLPADQDSSEGGMWRVQLGYGVGYLNGLSVWREEGLEPSLALSPEEMMEIMDMTERRDGDSSSDGGDTESGAKGAAVVPMVSADHTPITTESQRERQAQKQRTCLTRKQHREIAQCSLRAALLKARMLCLEEESYQLVDTETVVHKQLGVLHRKLDHFLGVESWLTKQRDYLEVVYLDLYKKKVKCRSVDITYPHVQFVALFWLSPAYVCSVGAARVIGKSMQCVCGALIRRLTAGLARVNTRAGICMLHDSLFFSIVPCVLNLNSTRHLACLVFSIASPLPPFTHTALCFCAACFDSSRYWRVPDRCMDRSWHAGKSWISSLPNTTSFSKKARS